MIDDLGSRGLKYNLKKKLVSEGLTDEYNVSFTYVLRRWRKQEILIGDGRNLIVRVYTLRVRNIVIRLIVNSHSLLVQHRPRINIIVLISVIVRNDRRIVLVQHTREDTVIIFKRKRNNRCHSENVYWNHWCPSRLGCVLRSNPIIEFRLRNDNKNRNRLVSIGKRVKRWYTVTGNTVFDVTTHTWNTRSNR